MTFSALCDQHDHQPPGAGRHPAAQGAVAPKAFKMVAKGQEISNFLKKKPMLFFLISAIAPKMGGTKKIKQITTYIYILLVRVYITNIIKCLFCMI